MFVSQAGVGIPPVRPGRRGTTPPLGLEAKSLKNGTTHYWISRSRAHTNKTNRLALIMHLDNYLSDYSSALPNFN